MADLIPDGDIVLYMDDRDFRAVPLSAATLTMHLVPAIPGKVLESPTTEHVTHLLVPAQQYASARIPQPDTASP